MQPHEEPRGIRADCTLQRRNLAVLAAVVVFFSRGGMEVVETPECRESLRASKHQSDYTDKFRASGRAPTEEQTRASAPKRGAG